MNGRGPADLFMRQLTYTDGDFRKKLARFCRRAAAPPEVAETVRGVLEDIRRRGDQAILACARKFDQVSLQASQMRVPEADIRAARRALPEKNKKAVREAIRCVADFHRKGLPRSWKGKNPHGATVGEVFYPIRRAGIHVPGKSVPLVSSVVMGVVLAKVAKVPEIAVCTPPRADGSVNPGILAALDLCGAREIYRVGGAQAIGALAYGTRTIPAADKIFGPGNAYVIEAKRQVFGEVGIDLLPGPSEVMVIADASARADFIASDLLAQAEHGTGREKVYLVAASEKLVAAVEREIKVQFPALSHQDCIREVLKNGFLAVVVPHLEAAAEVANYVAPEHLDLHAGKDQISRLVKMIRTAGAMLLGEETPAVLGDFTAGPSHTLPTGRTGRFCGGLQITDFFRRSSIVRYDRRSLAKAAPVVRAFSEMEQLEAHGHSLELRLSG